MKKLRLIKLGLLVALLLGSGALLAQIATPFDGNNLNITTEKGDIPEPIAALDLMATDAMIAGADYLQHAQADVTEDNAGNGNPDTDPNDAGWDWVLASPTFTHSASSSPTNIYGATAQGLYHAYLQSGDAGFFTALQDAATVMVNNANIRSSSDMVFLMNFQDLSGVTADIYQDAAKAKFDGRIADYGSATLLAQGIRDVRASQGYENGIIPWDVSTFAVVAQMLETRYPADPYDYAQASIDIAEVLYQDSYMTNPGYFDLTTNKNNGWDPTYSNTDYYWYTLGISGLIDAFNASGSHTGEISGLLTIMSDCQYESGAFSYCYGANVDDEDWQSTSYSVLSLASYDLSTYQNSINQACYWLFATQDPASGGWVYSSGNHYPEIGGENTAALYFGNADPSPVITIETPTAVSCGVYEFDVTVADFNAVGSISMTLEYTSSVLQYVGTTLNPAISGSSVNVLGGTYYLGGFYSPAISLPDDAVLFTLTFNLLDWTGASATLHWPTLPAEANEIAGPNGDPVYIDSFFDITYNFPQTLVVTETHVDADCPCNATGSIDLTVTGGTVPITYSWTGPGGFISTSQDISGLITGTYDVVVTDVAGCTESLSIFIDYIDDLTPPSITCPPQIDVVCPQNVSWITEIADITEIHCTAPIPYATTSYYWVDNGDWVYQTFHANNTGLLASVSFGLMDIIKLRPFDITVSLYEGQPDCSISAKYPVGCPLWVGTITFDAGGSNPDGIYTIDIPESARPYLIAGSQWYTLIFEGIGQQDDTWTHGWWLSETNCAVAPETYSSPMPGGGTYGDAGPNCRTNAHVAFNTVIATVPGLLVSDNCTVKMVGTDIPSGSFFDYGTTNVTFTATDPSGNSSSCVMPVVVTDNVLPTITCATPAASYVSDPGVCSYTVAGPTPGFVSPKIDNFWVATTGFNLEAVLPGGTANDPGETGEWYLYDQDPPNEWYNIWFYNEPLDLNRMKVIHMGFWIHPQGPNTYFNYVVNWSNDLWTGPGFPTPSDEMFIERSPINTMTVTGLEWVELYYIIPDYNPEWVSVDIWGDNIIIEPIDMPPPPGSALFPYWDPFSMIGGIIVHECLPKAGTFLDPIDFDDNCEVDYVINDYNSTSTLNGATFPVGTTTVIWTVFDMIGNSASCQYDVVVVDNQPPTITCAVPAASYNADLGVCTYTVPDGSLDPTAFGDNCGVLSVTNDQNGLATLQGVVFPMLVLQR